MIVLLLAAALAAPSPVPTGSYACPDLPPKIDRMAVPDYPDMARQQGAVGISFVNVDVDAAGRPWHVSIGKSSGYTVLDQAALRAAAFSRYLPARRNCVAAPGRLEVPVSFDGR